MLDREKFEEQPPAQFLALSQSDQQSKIRRRREIEKNWGCDVRDCIPLKISPRASGGRGTSKAKIGENVEMKAWWQWGVDFMHKLARVSSMTLGKLAFAQDLLLLEVNDRQAGTGGFRSVAEVVQQDLDRILKALRDAHEAGTPTSEKNDSEDETDSPDDEDSDAGHNLSVQREGSIHSSRAAVPIKREVQDEHTANFASNKRQRLVKSTSSQAKIAALRGKAMRREHEAEKMKVEAAKHKANAAKLQAEAAKLKAEAYELESKWILHNSE